ncbi:helix-turn-helix domain-containing protein [Furfurilactobacillus milii]|uniref:Helix-turn-helix domain-containing protein n=1 Tax=Furfurilactobacillus milii TaxID=2888272 RepID=A0A6N9I1V4_9LACO|nr:helix-turn-helix transcriptional regulator [Furfurilactobacillus milii]MYV17132.1 helix-turn-helix domain-containing protein [Furfurilactobacillus milii]
MASYGETFHQLRVGKGLTLKELADEQASVSFLSKFEQGQSKISVDRLMHLLKKMNVTADEYFFLQHDRYLNSPMPVEWREMGAANALTDLTNIFLISSGLAIRHQWKKLYARLDVLKENAKKSPTVNNVLGYDYGRMMLANHTGKSIEHSSDYAVKYLKQIDDWGIYEILVLESFLTAMPLADVELFTNIAERKLTANESIMYVAGMHRGFLVSSFSYFMSLDQFALANETLSKMEALHKKRDGRDLTANFAMTILWCEGWLKYRVDDKVLGKSKMNDATTMMRLCKEDRMFRIYDDFTAEIVSAPNDHDFHYGTVIS